MGNLKKEVFTVSFQKEIDDAIKTNKIYFVGERLPTDWYEAVSTWTAFSDQGDIKALANIGWCYYTGNGVQAPDYEKAKVLLEEAIAKGDPFAAFTMHELNEHLKNNDEAERYLKLSVEMGSVRGIQKTEKLNLEISEKQDEEYFEKSKKMVENVFLDIKKLVQSGDNSGAKNLIKKFVDENPNLKFVESFLAYLELTVKYLGAQRMEGGHCAEDSKSFFIEKYEVVNNGNYEVDITIIGLDNRGGKVDHGNAFIPAKSTKIIESGPVTSESKVAYVETGYDWDAESIIFTDATKKLYVGNRKAPASIRCNLPVIRLEYIKFKKDPRCFVLTACFNDNSHPTVTSFRNFRDDYLMRSVFGKSLVKFYYKEGPKWAERIETKPLAKAILRQLFRNVEKLLPKKIG